MGSSHPHLRAHNLCAICLGRTFIITEGEYYGLAPWVAEPAYSCLFLSGASAFDQIAAVVRPVQRDFAWSRRLS